MEIIEAVGLISGLTIGLTAIITAIAKIHKYFIKVDDLEKEVEDIKKHHEKDIKKIEIEENQEFKEIQEEQRILIIAVLACLKSLRGDNINGEVDKAISMVEEHLITKSHD